MLNDWKSEFICFGLTMLLSILVYYGFIIRTENMFPSIDEIRDGIWIGIITFFGGLLFKYVYNNFKLDDLKASAMRKKYILRKYRKFFKKYDSYVKVEDFNLNILVYAIMIFEDYNRPWFIRLLEYVKFFYTKEATLGIMQVKTKKFINNVESIQLAIEKIKKAYSEKKIDDFEGIRYVIRDYNNSRNYVDEVQYIYLCLEDYLEKKMYCIQQIT